jgi:hypothetical protein
MAHNKHTDDEIDPRTGVRMKTLEKCRLTRLRRERQKLIASLASNGKAIIKAETDRQRRETSTIEQQPVNPNLKEEKQQ